MVNDDRSYISQVGRESLGKAGTIVNTGINLIARFRRLTNECLRSTGRSLHDWLVRMSPLHCSVDPLRGVTKHLFQTSAMNVTKLKCNNHEQLYWAYCIIFLVLERLKHPCVAFIPCVSGALRQSKLQKLTNCEILSPSARFHVIFARRPYMLGARLSDGCLSVSLIIVNGKQLHQSLAP